MTRFQIVLSVVVLALVLLGTRALGTESTRAQTAPATPAADAVGGAVDATDDDDNALPDPRQSMAARYDDFLARLAASLGTDPAALDAALRTTLKEEIDERQAAGDLSAAGATAIKTEIDAAEALPIGGFGGPLGGFHGHGEGRGHGGPFGPGPGGHHGPGFRSGGPWADDRRGEEPADDDTSSLPGAETEPAGELPRATASPTI